MNRRPTGLIARQSAILCVIAALTTLGCRSSASTTPADPGSGFFSSATTHTGGATRVSYSGAKRVNVIDPQAGMVAATLQIPSGWKFAGQITNFPGCHGVDHSIDYTALGQDGITAVIHLPGVRWAVAQPAMSIRFHAKPPCPLIDITTPADFLTKIAIPNMHPGAKIESVHPLQAEGQASLAQQLEQMRQGQAHLPPQMRYTSQTLDGARVRLEYVRNGQPVEELLVVVVSCVANQMSGEHCTVGNGISIVRAPKGQLDAVLAQPAVMNIVKSFQPNPEYQQRLAQQQNAINQQAAASEQQQFNNNMRNNQAQFNQSIANDRAQDAQRAQGTANAMAADRATQNSIDAAAHQQVNNSLDRRDYINPNTGQTITASDQYNHAWVNSSNDTLVQTDSNFDPNGSINPVHDSWTELVPK